MNVIIIIRRLLGSRWKIETRFTKKRKMNLCEDENRRLTSNTYSGRHRRRRRHPYAVDVVMSSKIHTHALAQARMQSFRMAFARLESGERGEGASYGIFVLCVGELIIIQRIRFIYIAGDDAEKKLQNMCGSCCSSLSLRLSQSPCHPLVHPSSLPLAHAPVSIIQFKRSDRVKNLNWAHFTSQADSYKSFNLQTEYCAHFEQIKTEKKYSTNDNDNTVRTK